jgi:hypothetical protein
MKAKQRTNLSIVLVYIFFLFVTLISVVNISSRVRDAAFLCPLSYYSCNPRTFYIMENHVSEIGARNERGECTKNTSLCSCSRYSLDRSGSGRGCGSRREIRAFIVASTK